MPMTLFLLRRAEDLQNLINIVDEYCRDWRMLLNLGKSKAMVVQASQEQDCGRGNQ